MKTKRLQTPASLISLCSVTKNFGRNVVLDGIDFSLLAGEIHALVGENGAGKSTCMGLLYGLHQPNAGHIKLNGEPIQIESTAHAQTLGIGCVFQELSLAGSLSVAENIFAGRAPTLFGVVRWTQLRQQAESLLAEFDLSIDVSRPVDSYPVSTQQIIEIAKALSLNSKVLLLDEPTSALNPDEVKTLFVVLRKLIKKGIGIVYVSHHLSEVFDIADRITVLRDGYHISTTNTLDSTQTQVVSEMLGSTEPESTTQETRPCGDELLQVNNLNSIGKFDDISFSAHRGEIVGLAGLFGSRRNEIVRTIAGLNQAHTGSIQLNGTSVNFRSIRDAIKSGIGFIPEDRKTDGLFLTFPLSTNLVACSLDKHVSAGVVSRSSIQAATHRAKDTFNVKSQNTEDTVGSLSGGNQQKILLGKWLERNPDLLIIEEPTKGVDVGAKFQIHKELQRRAAGGMAIIIVSSDFPELVSLCDRILVIHEGKIVDEVDAKNTTDDQLLFLAAGIPTVKPDAIHTGAQL
jgi:ABC-type sugar transport system ATPase subunit